ncbi:MAG: hypothetical protein R2696_15415 [Microthrixaceae bacterium]
MGTPAVTNLIRENKVRQIRNMIATGQKDGMMVLEQHLAQLINSGVISYEDAVYASVHPRTSPGSSPSTPTEPLRDRRRAGALVFGTLLAFAVGSFICVVIDRLPIELEEPNEYGDLRHQAVG